MPHSHLANPLSLICVGVCFVYSSLVFPSGKPDKDLPFTVMAVSEWTQKTDKREDTGDSSLRVTGRLVMKDEDEEFRFYKSTAVNGHLGYQLRTRVVDPNSRCFDRIIFEEKGSGNVRPEMVLQTFFGDSGKGQAMQYLLALGKVSPLELINFMSAPAVDTYSFRLSAPFGISTSRKRWSVSDACAVPKEDTRKKPVVLEVLCGELAGATIVGGDKWRIGDGWLIGSHPSDMSYGYSECLGEKLWIPEQGHKDANYRVAWVIGEPAGMVRIDWENHDDPRYPGRAVDITDDQQHILVGKRVRLTARLEPQDLPIREGQWEIEGEVIKRFKADDSFAEVVPLSDQHKKNPKIDFVWADGAFAGDTLTVKYTETLNSANLEAQTTFKVYKPESRFDYSTGSISLSYFSRAPASQALNQSNEYLRKSKCKLTAVDASGPAPPAQCKLRFDEGMVIVADTEMPLPFSDAAHCLQYVQLVRPEEWTTLACMRPQKLLIDQFQGQLCVDYGYPYIKGNIFRDSPGTVMNPPYQNKPCWVDKSWRHDSFDTYLMFLPCEDESADCEWIPLKMGQWDWRFAIEKVGDVADYNNDAKAACPKIYSLTADPASGLKINDDPGYPTWSCQVKGFSKATSDPIPTTKPPGW